VSPYVTSSNQIDGLLMELAAAHWDSLAFNVKVWISCVRRLMVEQTESFQDQGLYSVVLWHIHLQMHNLWVNFLLMINLIHLVCECQR